MPEKDVSNVYITFVEALLSSTNIDAKIRGLANFCHLTIEEAQKIFSQYKELESTEIKNPEINTEVERQEIINNLAMSAQMGKMEEQAPRR